MLQHEQETCARPDPTRRKLLAIADELRIVKLFGDAAFSVASELPADQAGPLHALLDLIADRLTTIAATLDGEGHIVKATA